MKFAILTVLALCLTGKAARLEEVGLPEIVVTSETVKNAEDEEDPPLVEQNDEDLAAFVTDYIRKDIQLKGSFLFEDKASKKIFRLELVAVDLRISGGETAAKAIKAEFKDAAGKRFTAYFHLQNGPWGGLDIYKIELKAATGETAPGKKKGT